MAIANNNSNVEDMSIENSTALFHPLFNICPRDVPNASVYLQVISSKSSRIAMFATFGVLVALTLSIYAYELYSIISNKMHIMRRIRTIALLSLYPVYSLLALLALLIPRSAPLLDLVANAYFAFTLWHFFQLLMLYYGGEKRMIETFGEDPVSIKVPPICCFLCCLKPVKMTRKTVRYLKIGAAQFLLFRPVLLVLSMILWVEDVYEYTNPETGKMEPFKSASTYIALVNMGTTLVAMYAIIILFRNSLKRLDKFHIRGKFIVFQLTLIVGSMQDAVLTQLANFNVLNCNQYLPTKSVAMEYHHMAMIAEMFILSIAALCVYWKYIRYNIPLNHPSLNVPNDSDHPHLDQLDDDGNSHNNNDQHTRYTVNYESLQDGSLSHM